VQERYVACAQIILWFESIVMLDNRLDTTQETKIIFKMRAAHYDQVREIIEQNSKYDIPEITWFKVEGETPLTSNGLRKTCGCRQKGNPVFEIFREVS
jgi:uncharacterized protein involved in tolerance to divalent cations